MDKVIGELQYNHKLADTIEYFYDKLQFSGINENNLNQYYADVSYLLNCNTIKEINKYKKLNENKIYNGCLAVEL